MGPRLPLALITVASVAIVVRAFQVHPLLPDPVASHFDAAGQADGWQSKHAFFVLGAVLLAVLLALSAGLPLLVRALPVAMINLPRREHWLAPERRAQTLDALAAALGWFGVATLAFFAGVFELVYAANLAPEPRGLGGALWLLLGGYLGFTGLWLWAFLRRFRRTAPAASGKSR